MFKYLTEDKIQPEIIYYRIDTTVYVCSYSAHV